MKKENSPAHEVLIVDDSPETVELIRRNLESVGYHVFAASNVQSAIKLLETISIDLLITDLKMPGESGLTLVRHVSENFKGVAILVITGFPSIQGAVESIKIGAEEYLVKSFTDEELFQAVKNALKKTSHKKKSGKELSPQTFGIVGASEGMVQVFDTITKARATQATVLIQGESGTGKELVARALHYGGNDSKAPFVPVNCGGIPDNLLESELFGYVKGAFTGANETRPGFFQTADKGTIFLDEISNTSLAMQAKLLRVLQEKEFYMVGAKKSLKVNLRVVAATNVDLMQLIKKGLFREDLYYRLNIITIDLPPLRERGADILQLAEFFLTKYVKELGKSAMHFTPKASRALQGYAWPGNVRELQNLMHRLVILADESTIDVPDLPEAFRFSASQSGTLDRTLDDMVKGYIADVLAANQNNVSLTARVLGIDRKTLREKMKKA
ncbi:MULTISPECIES: sigma-54 dependent transcriptional regulator [unclassified Imperialibacter]|uniref:sigma-54-dependent transcriptional regulator n=1 Tax=unclassified Imperialibacter TaxID=2629706 RepID=UPI00125C2988|nr:MULTISPECIES: sigma-54 dependent transcriptional regulator [unclassified Imperialibacter]CAD5290437.1 Two component, sigma54 specific, transcriptional regulator, Fis family [Imperialibacter sp. 89]CAD5290734.1 Two component, sigma54 specific, transcriptional regulator, Fis family [Imperialibacter sp. 75]VVT34461.1 Two component, sigma54 specific, transcriptional regulator, Fis family [Imperialibacter sp. EC-SDR9]